MKRLGDIAEEQRVGEACRRSSALERLGDIAEEQCGRTGKEKRR